MIPDQYHFLLITLLLIAALPLLSIFKKVPLPRHWKPALTAMAISGGIFLAWQELFTRIGVWRFNEQYLLGIYIGALPLEVYLLFFFGAFVFLFLYRLLFQTSRDALAEFHQAITWFFLVCTVFLGTYFYPKLYTSSCFFLGTLLLSLQLFVFKSNWMSRFYLAFFVAIIPFIVFDSWLSGAFTEEPLIWHNALEMMGVNVLSMPLEDIVFFLDFLLLTTMIYQRGSKARR